MIGRCSTHGMREASTNRGSVLTPFRLLGVAVRYLGPELGSNQGSRQWLSEENPLNLMLCPAGDALGMTECSQDFQSIRGTLRSPLKACG